MEPKPSRRAQYAILIVVALLGGLFIFKSCQGGPLGHALWYRDNGSAYALVYTGDRKRIEVRLLRPGAEARALWDGPVADMPRLLGEHGSTRLVRFSGTLNEPPTQMDIVSAENELLGQLTLAAPAFPLQKIHDSIVACRGFDTAARHMNGLLRYGMDGQLVADFKVDAAFGYHIADSAPRILVWDATERNCVLYDFDTAKEIHRFQRQRGFLSPDGRVAVLANPGEKRVTCATVGGHLGEVQLEVLDVERAGFGFASDSSSMAVTDGPKLHRAQLEPFKNMPSIDAPGREIFDPSNVHPLPGGRIAACLLGGPRNKPVRTVVVYNAAGKNIFEKVFEPSDDNGDAVFAMMPDLEGHRLYVLHGDETHVLDIPETADDADENEGEPAGEEDAAETAEPKVNGD